MAGNGNKWVEIGERAESGWKCLEIAQNANGWKGLEMAIQWLELALNVLKLPEMAGIGLKWLDNFGNE